ncbi:MAG TPA: NAD-dependent deacylase [Anaerolineales bacterium]|nr:NAD-dependent deacylase [Anaerolineales bacterium]
MVVPDELIQRLRTARRVAALTGAGVSQESGLRTFRDAQTGMWAQYRPEELASPEAFRRDPKLVWDWYAWRREAVKAVRPNPGHYALAQIEKRVPEFTLITQNVDGLHRMAGSQNLLELHGNIQRVRCAECYTFTEIWDDDTETVPRCRACGGLLRPDVVWFGESLPRDQLEAAVEAARACDVFLSIGTSGVVQPAASLAFAAHNRGALVVEVNAEPTPLTSRADYVLQGKSGEILPGLVEVVWG